MHDHGFGASTSVPDQIRFPAFVDGNSRHDLTYRLEQVPEGTRVTISRGFVPDEMPGMMRFLLQIGVVRLMDIFMTAKIIDRGLARLRDYVEQPHKAST